MRKVKTNARVCVLSLCVALLLTGAGCASSQIKLAADVAKVAQSGLIAVRVAEQDLYDKGQIPVEKHREHQQNLWKAFDLHEQAVKATLLAADGKPADAGEFARKLQEAWLILQSVGNDLPIGPERSKATAVLQKGIF